MRNPSAFILAAFIVGGALGLAPLVTPHIVSEQRDTNRYQRAQTATVVIETPHGFGTGFVQVRGTNVFVWTAKHVVATSDIVAVGRYIGVKERHSGNVVFTARVLARFRNLDVALLQIDAPPEAFGRTEFGNDAAVGENLFHVGNFWGPDFDDSVSVGIVSQVGVKASGEGWPWRLVDQGDFAAMPGSSGGPVFNGAGEVVGVLVGGPHRGADRICCYVPVREIRKEAEAEGVAWAVEGRAVSDALLDILAEHAKMPPPPAIIAIEIIPTPKGKKK